MLVKAAIGGGTVLVPSDPADCWGPPVEVDAPVLCATEGSETNGVLSLAAMDMRVMGIQNDAASEMLLASVTEDCNCKMQIG